MPWAKLSGVVKVEPARSQPATPIVPPSTERLICRTHGASAGRPCNAPWSNGYDIPYAHCCSGICTRKGSALTAAASFNNAYRDGESAPNIRLLGERCVSGGDGSLTAFSLVVGRSITGSLPTTLSVESFIRKAAVAQLSTLLIVKHVPFASSVAPQAPPPNTCHRRAFFQRVELSVTVVRNRVPGSVVGAALTNSSTERVEMPCT